MMLCDVTRYDIIYVMNDLNLKRYRDYKQMQAVFLLLDYFSTGFDYKS